MKFLYLKGAVFFTFIPVVLNLRLLDDGRSLNCTQKEVQCTAEFNNCMYKEWLIRSDFTPNGPDNLTVKVDVRSNMKGDLEPVIVAEWKAKDEGSITHLNGTELNVMKSSTNEHLCVHYKFHQAFKSMRNSAGEKWSFSLDKVVVDPDTTYVVTVSNLPKPNLENTGYNVFRKVYVPGCDDPLMRTTKICFEIGDTWLPNITVGRTTAVNGKDILHVAFNPAEHAEKYNVFMKCNRDSEMQTLYNENKPLLNVTYDLEKWPRTCCNFDVQIQPFFQKCTNDCRRSNRSFNICGPVPASPPENNSALWIICVGLCLLFCAIGVCAIYLRRGKQPGGEKPLPKPHLQTPLSSGPRSVLIIYSRDHPLYTDIVLKLCAFLRAKCSVDVVLDLLDTTWLGTIGRLQWLEEKKRKIEESSGKILVLCSRGVQAKWGAMCGDPRILLREDVRSPVGDMLTLAFQLITPDMQRPASYGKYLVAYFDDVCSEGDVPSMFDIAVKYKLMKHFEELYFRILDVEKYQQGVKHCIEGIGKDDYFNCPSGEALKNAIEAFQMHQMKNPDWFEKECVTSEEEVRGEADPLLEMPMQPIYELTPMLNVGLPILVKEIDINHETHSVCAVIPQIQENPEESSVVIINPRIQPEHSEVFSYYPAMEHPLELPSVTGFRTPVDPQIYPCLLAEPGPVETSHPPFAFPMGEPSDNCPTDSRKRFLVAPPPSMEDSFHLYREMSQPVEMEESEMEGASETRPSRGSDQGYGSRYSTVREDPKIQQDLSSLAKLQMDLFLNSPISSGFCTKTMEI
ncbi:hypothetical protein QQF64_035311 [Cirrhinus molitorella]|uniref:Uncharacterized protein n=2 Tax=Cirrhinus molitorella TaxID=172907 RepID=A0ABR3NFE9_9TELE|nr:hypothetical protein Q8A67_012852 [Cirrhinus molitorella]